MYALSIFVITNRAPYTFTLDYHILNRLVISTTKWDKTFLTSSPKNSSHFLKYPLTQFEQKTNLKGAAMEFFYLLS